MAVTKIYQSAFSLLSLFVDFRPARSTYRQEEYMRNDTDAEVPNDNLDVLVAAIVDRLLEFRRVRSVEHPQNEFDFARWDT